MPLHRKLFFGTILLVGGLAAAILALLSPGEQRQAQATPSSYTLALLRLSYSDGMPPLHSADDLTRATDEMHEYFRLLSYGALDLQFRVVDVSVDHDSAYYWTRCRSRPDDIVPCSELPGHVYDAARDDGFAFGDVNGFVIVSACGLSSDVSVGRVQVGGIFGPSFTVSYDFDCAGDATLNSPGPSGVWWNGWAHEIGHQLQTANGVDFGGWLGHPGGYSSGYDLMDSCYPCHESAYGLSGPPVMAGGKTVFPGWLPPDKVETIDMPGGTRVLAPISQDPGTTTAPQALKIQITAGSYYLVDARLRVGTDATYNVGPGLYDEGIEILEVEESRNPPVRVIATCPSVIPGPCTNSRDSPDLCRRADGGAVRRVGDQPDRCWPFPLWHPGQVYNDATNAIRIRVDSRVEGGYSVTVEKGIAPGHPDVFMLPWRTPPLNTWETVDIWVDSSCNGYESVVGASGLRYGRRADGTVVGNGDDPCANHQNRIYAHVRNGGDRPATDIQVRFQVTNPLGVGIAGASAWTEVGITTAAEFPALASLAPGASTDVYVNWTPRISLTPEQIAARHFGFHSCVRVIIDPVAGESILSNQDGVGEQENFDDVEAVMDPVTSTYLPLEREFFVRNNLAGVSLNQALPDLPQRFLLGIESELPPDWRFLVGEGSSELILGPDEVRYVPVKIEVPDGVPIGQTYLLKVDARTLVNLVNPINGLSHPSMDTVAGVVLAAHTVLGSGLSLDAIVDPDGRIIASGALTPALGGARIAIDYTDPGGDTTTGLAMTGDSGNYKDGFCLSAPGRWMVRAFWQGDLMHAGATSREVSVDVAAIRCKEEPPQVQATPTPTRPPTPTPGRTPPPNATPTPTPVPGQQTPPSPSPTKQGS